MQLTPAVEDYLKAIYNLQQDDGAVANARLAAYFGISPPAVTDMIKKLAAQGLVTYLSRGSVRLTASGEEVTRKTLQRHNLIELYLVKAVGMSGDQAHAEAEVLEHHLSAGVAERISIYLDGLPNHPQETSSSACCGLGQLSDPGSSPLYDVAQTEQG